MESSYEPAVATALAFMDEGSVKPLVLQATSALGAGAFERIHPAGAYIILTRPGPFDRGAGMPPFS